MVTVLPPMPALRTVPLLVSCLIAQFGQIAIRDFGAGADMAVPSIKHRCFARATSRLAFRNYSGSEAGRTRRRISRTYWPPWQTGITKFAAATSAPEGWCRKVMPPVSELGITENKRNSRSRARHGRSQPIDPPANCRRAVANCPMGSDELPNAGFPSTAIFASRAVASAW